jgi:hypothetical protein
MEGFNRCVDYAVKIRVNPQQTGIDTNVKHSMVRHYSFLFLLFAETTHPCTSPIKEPL